MGIRVNLSDVNLSEENPMKPKAFRTIPGSILRTITRLLSWTVSLWLPSARWTRRAWFYDARSTREGNGFTDHVQRPGYSHIRARHASARRYGEQIAPE